MPKATRDGKGEFLTKKSWFFSGFFCDWVLKISFCYDIMYRRISFSLVENFDKEKLWKIL